MTRVVHVVLPNDIDDPSAPSGGNVYDRRVCHGLAALGWSVREHPVPGAWPWPGRAARSTLSRLLSALPDQAVVLLDGLIASAVPDVLVPRAGRLRLVVLVHLPLGDGAAPALPGLHHPDPGNPGSGRAVRPGSGREDRPDSGRKDRPDSGRKDRPGPPSLAEIRRRERATLASAGTVITTSGWARQRLLDLYPLSADRVRVAPPGVEPAELVPGSPDGAALLCVAAVTPHKGHDVLARALADVADLPWSCVCVGSLDRDPGFAEEIRRRVDRYGLTGRLRLVGPRTGGDLDAAYASADALVLPSRGETYGMVVTEALARGIPVIATAANGLPEALGHAPDGSLPGLLVPPGDPAALAGALRRWLGEANLRDRLRQSARDRRSTLTGWAVTARLVGEALDAAPAICGGPE